MLKLNGGMKINDARLWRMLMDMAKIGPRRRRRQ